MVVGWTSEKISRLSYRNKRTKRGEAEASKVLPATSRKRGSCRSLPCFALISDASHRDGTEDLVGGATASRPFPFHQA